MIGKKINQLATELAPESTDLTIIGDPISGVSKKITLAQLGAIFSGAVSFYNDLASFPVSGDINIIYCAKDTQKLYLWSGSAYTEVFPSQALLDTYQLRSEKGNANGYASLDSGGKVPISQLPSSIMEYKGTWNAATNTPTLANGTGDTGDVYICNVAGTVNFGAGPITFAVGDYVIYSGTIWQRSSGAVGTVTSVAASITGDSVTISGSPVTTSGTLAFAFNGTTAQYIRGNGTLETFPSLTGFVPYTGATANVDLGTHTLLAAKGIFSSSGSGDTVGITHSSGSGIALNITKGGNGEGLYINKTSGSGNAATIIGTLNATTLVKSGGTSSQFLKADGSVDSTAYGTGSVTSVGLSSSTSGVTIGSTPITTSGTITLSIATASGSQQGLLSSTDWTTFNNKQGTITLTTTGTSGAATFSANTLNIPNYAPDLSGYVTIATTQTITGAKTFNNSELNTIFVSNPDTTGATTGSGIGFKAYNGSSVTQYGGIFLTSNTWSFGTYSAQQLSIGADGTGGLALRSANSAPISFFTGGASAGVSPLKMTLNASGNLSIGNTNDTFRLDVSGTLRATGAATFSSSVTATSESSLFKEGFRINATTTGGGGSQPAYTYYTAAGSKRWSHFLNVGDDKFHIANASNSELFTIQQNGNVGIGTANPSTKFVVSNSGAGGIEMQGNSSVSGGAFLQTYNRSTNAFFDFDIVCDNMIFRTGQSYNPAMRITSGGNVGIGTSSLFTSSGYTVLDLYGSTNGGHFLVRSPNITAEYVVDEGSGGAYFGTRSNHFISLRTNTTERMRITTTTPSNMTCVLINKTTAAGSYPLQVAGIAGAYMASATGVGDANYYSTSNTIGYHFYADRGSGSVFNVATNGAIFTAQTIQTGAPANGTAQPWKLGNAVSGTVSPSHYLVVEINGQSYTINAFNGFP
jgi:hypothetical protein